MVSLAVVAAYMSTSLPGKFVAIWGPTLLFFSQGFEHAVVNMFLMPVGMMLGAEIITGSFALLPVAAADGQKNAGLSQVFANWGWVFLGNLLGSVLYAALFAIALTTAGDAPINAVGNKLIAIAQAKTTYYASHGSAGLLAAFTKGI